MFNILSMRAARTLPGILSSQCFIPVCCVCGLIRDDADVPVDRDHWVTKRTYRKHHGVNLAECHFTHTYCSGCAADLTHRAKLEAKPSRSTIISQLLARDGQLGWFRRFTTRATS